jgi:hypothetical protein
MGVTGAPPRGLLLRVRADVRVLGVIILTSPLSGITVT